MRVLLASVSNAPDDVFKAHFTSVQELEVPAEVELDLAYISDGLSEASCAMVSAAGGRIADALAKPEDATYARHEGGHDWNVPTFEWLAREKQRLIDLALEESYAAIFFVDSDLVLGPETFHSLLRCQKPIVSAVFWTRWNPEAPWLPQTWLEHPYELSGRSGSDHLEEHEYLRRLSHRQLVEVGGLGACTLIRAEHLSDVFFYPLVDGLPQGGMWQGEDRHFCVRANRTHVSLWADAWPDIFHIYRPSDIEALPEARALWGARKKRAVLGDLVSLTVEPLEEPELQDFREHMRGRIGALPILPALERSLLEMNVGTERIVNVRFPGWWPEASYRHQEKKLLLRLLDVKEARK